MTAPLPAFDPAVAAYVDARIADALRVDPDAVATKIREILAKRHPGLKVVDGHRESSHGAGGAAAGIGEPDQHRSGDREPRVKVEGRLQVRRFLRFFGVGHESSSAGGSGAGTPGSASKVGVGADSPRPAGSSPAGAVGTPGAWRRVADRAALWAAWALVRYFEHRLRERTP